MFKKLIAIAFAASVAFAPFVIAPAAAMTQAGPPVTASPSREGVITKGALGKPTAVVRPANSKSTKCGEEAAAKGLSGKPRKRFLAECKKGSM